MIFLQTSTTTIIANPYILALISLIGPVAVVIISWINTQITAKLQRDLSENTVQLQRDLANTNFEEKRVEEKRKVISKRLDEFYAPLQQYLNISKELNKIFKKDKPKGFRVLTYLLDPNQEYQSAGKVVLTENDKVIFNEILEVGKKIEELIISKASLADDPRLSYKYVPSGKHTDVQFEGDNGLLAILGAHLLIIRHAYQGHIIGQVEAYRNYVYPLEINEVIKENIDRLNSNLSQLST